MVAFVVVGGLVIDVELAAVPVTYPPLTPTGAADYWLRASQGDETLTSTAPPSSHHLVQLWPAALEPGLIFKHSDRYGAGCGRRLRRTSGVGRQPLIYRGLP